MLHNNGWELEQDTIGRIECGLLLLLMRAFEAQGERFLISGEVVGIGLPAVDSYVLGY